MQNMKTIQLTQGYEAIVDDEDYEELSKWKWHANGKYPHVYAKRSSYVDGKQIIECMHRVILNTPKDMDVDHQNHNTLDNRKENIRNVPTVTNVRNTKISKRNKSGYVGVSLIKKTNKWRAEIQVNGKGIYLGCFEKMDDAINKRNDALKNYGFHENHGAK